ncbi:serine/threonine-protein phosphatase Pgam5, mitochondrial-like isoform X2 [Aethina tumida]|uniref:serine/threonine-protein phosphatase Pgam5, mitochondrial-like isoform X2 n=1 Tax=Aethina tumida TaxID=116153 RepID=UPI00096B35ED|nr:serine/threonine-protein phosphatase Pgam5, mitochondrial-like isoform X2 [Aethina tumida]
MKAFTTGKKLLWGLGAISGAAGLYFINAPEKIVHNSWTTNYEPNLNAKWDDNWDHREPQNLVKLSHRHKVSEIGDNNNNELLEKVTPKAYRHIILIRHGQYNLDGRTDEDRVLTKLGRLQAEYTGKRLKELGIPYTDMVKSTMSRAQETGSIISEIINQDNKLPISHCDLIREGAPIPPEPPIGRWKPEVHFYQDGSRIEAGFRKYFHRASPSQEKDSFTLLVCHANVIRYFVCRALQFPAEGWLRISLNHASLTWITITPSGRCILKFLGDTGHMPPDVISS